MFRKNIYTTVIVYLVSSCCFSQVNEVFTLFSDKKTDYVIYVSKDASESELWAAKELKYWLKEISKVDFEIIQYSASEIPSVQKPIIYVGFNEALKDKTNMPEPKYHDESFRYFNKGPEIYIYGGKSRGTMYGVMTFLENEFGCRWYTPTVAKAPFREKYTFTTFNHKEAPGVQVRNNFFYTAFDPVWAARNKMNGRLSSNPIDQPGGCESYWGVHTFYQFIPPDEFFNEHPEYFSLINGVRTANNPNWGNRGQLCLSNPDVLRIVTERVKKAMRENPDHLIYSVSQNDWSNPCQCDKCEELVRKYGGKQSGILIWFVNQVAEVIEKEFPDKYIGTLAYQYTRSAPQNIKPRRNVVIRLCPIEACVAHPLETCPHNKAFLRDMKDWVSISPKLYIWDYVVNFARYIMPYPNFSVLQPNIKTFAKNKAIGIMEQGSYQARGGEFQELKSYLISRLLWNPDCNVVEIIDDFMYGYYGRSGQYIRQYFDLVQSLVNPDTHIFIGLEADNPIFSDDFVRQSIKILTKAIKVADNDILLKRVELAMAPVLYLKCRRTPVVARNDGTFNKFLKIMEEEKIDILAEYDENLDTFKEYVLSAR